ncbi:MAG: hypothetical protein JXC85_02805 [Candidatus Aenigmarchaeota archaeon]|nr:hypothetical protein [Candidatus Aenigmarchaeota archaeon]
MADILQIVQQFLCYGNSDCINMFNSYASKPMEGLFYLVFFPIVFIIIFIYLLAHRYFPDHRSLNILLSLAFFAFIILQGWYYFFMILGQLWYIVIILLGFLWMALFGLLGKGKSGGGGQARTGGSGGMFDGVLGAAGKRLKVQMSSELKDHESRLEALLKSMAGLIGDMKRAGSKTDIDNVYRAYVDLLPQIDSHLDSLRQMTAIKGFKVSGKYNELLSRYKKLSSEMDGLHSKRGGKAAA